MAYTVVNLYVYLLCILNWPVKTYYREYDIKEEAVGLTGAIPTAAGLSPDKGGAGHKDSDGQEGVIVDNFDAGLNGSSPNLRAKKATGGMADPGGIQLQVMNCDKEEGHDVEEPVPAGHIQEEQKEAYSDTSDGRSIQF